MFNFYDQKEIIAYGWVLLIFYASNDKKSLKNSIENWCNSEENELKGILIRYEQDTL